MGIDSDNEFSNLITEMMNSKENFSEDIIADECFTFLFAGTGIRYLNDSFTLP